VGSSARRDCIVDESICNEALDLLSVDRMLDYGHPSENLTRTATLWSVVLGVDVDASQVATCMALMKISRQCHTPLRDNTVDAIAYLLIADSLMH
jgi:hypothetical protein